MAELVGTSKVLSTWILILKAGKPGTIGVLYPLNNFSLS